MNHDILRRYAFIEAQLLWGGGLTAGELGDAFGIARQNAQRTIESYRRKHPGEMHYDRSARRQVPTDSFETHYIRSDVGRFLGYQRAATFIARFYDEPGWADLPFADADVLIRPLYVEEAVRTLLETLRRNAAVEIEYWSKQGTRLRCISPHTLVFADGRYHVRAYCHEKLDYFDFVLTRILVATPANQPWVSADGDKDWHRRRDLKYRINPRLPESAQAAIRLDYLPGNQDFLVIRGLREALAYYVNRRLCRNDWRFDVPLWIACCASL